MSVNKKAAIHVDGLHAAVAAGQLEAVRSLLTAGADANGADEAGFTPLHHAASQGHSELVPVLLEHGANVDATDVSHGNTAAHLAAWKGFSRTLEALAKAKPNLDAKNASGFASLHLACQNGHNQCCRIVLWAGGAPDVRNGYGDTPAHTAARYGHAGVLRILISAFCSVNSLNKNGDSGLHVAAAMGWRKLTRILLEAGADRTLRNRQGETPMDIAKRKEMPEIIQILTDPPPPRPVQRKTKDDPLPQSARSSARKKKGQGGPRVHFLQQPTDDEDALARPYGCPLTPSVENFPMPQLDSLPEEPLKKGEQYYVDLAGNIKKGQVGVGHACYCAPQFHHLEKKIESDKEEVLGQIERACRHLKTRISHLERRTRHHLTALRQQIEQEEVRCSGRIHEVVQEERREARKRMDSYLDSKILRTNTVYVVKSKSELLLSAAAPNGGIPHKHNSEETIPSRMCKSSEVLLCGVFFKNYEEAVATRVTK